MVHVLLFKRSFENAEAVADYPSRTVVNSYGLKWSKDKLDAIKVSTPEDEWGEYIFGYIQYHTRYTDLSRADFLKNQGEPMFENWKGFGCNMETVLNMASDIAAGYDVSFINYNLLYHEIYAHFRFLHCGAL